MAMGLRRGVRRGLVQMCRFLAALYTKWTGLKKKYIYNRLCLYDGQENINFSINKILHITAV